ncbi:hypothetical protein [Haliangium sp.]|uniref:hypothetical protein n=1 Tax=Haliangium sp. TaxID=2663208 RepID=UPI003D128EA4
MDDAALQVLTVEVVKAFAAVLAAESDSDARATCLRRCAGLYDRLVAVRPDEDAATIAYRFAQLGVPMGVALRDVSGVLDEIKQLGATASNGP